MKIARMTYGTDPEGFFRHRGKIIGSERIIPENGYHNVVRDGIQFELNPPPSTEVHGLAHGISHSFKQLRALLAEKYPDVTISFDGLVEVDREELDALSERSRVLGCQPSKNVYGDKPITVDTKTYRKRSAGGHIHCGINGTALYDSIRGYDERQRLAPLMDIFVGNTCVLLDRDPGAAERRQNYGRAGEYRDQPHGFEYRTTSNFWLRGYPLMSMTFGMASLAASVLYETVAGVNDLEGELVSIVDISTFIEAIDNNDFNLAMKNLESLRPFFNKFVRSRVFPINAANFDKFIEFAVGVERFGIQQYFPTETIVDRWCNLETTHFNAYLGK